MILSLTSLNPAINPSLNKPNLYLRSRIASIKGRTPNSCAFKNVSSLNVNPSSLFHNSDKARHTIINFIRPTVRLFQKPPLFCKSVTTFTIPPTLMLIAFLAVANELPKCCTNPVTKVLIPAKSVFHARYIPPTAIARGPTLEAIALIPPTRILLIEVKLPPIAINTVARPDNEETNLRATPVNVSNAPVTATT